MRFNPKHLHRYVLVGGTLVALSCVPGTTWARQSGTASQTGGQVQAQGQMQDQGQMQMHWNDWVALDQFLDAHPDIDAALRANPDLIYDQNFMGQHQDFRNFCDSHPGIGQDMDQNRPQFRRWFAIRRDLASMNTFFSTRPEVENALEANPKLIDDANFLQQHPGLQDFLNSHPQVRQAFENNPAFFVRLEARFQERMHGQDGMQNGNPGAYNRGQNADRDRNGDQAQNSGQYRTSSNQTQTQGQEQFQGQGRFHGQNIHWSDWAALDQFLDAHPDIAAALQANPDLIDDQTFLGQHQDFRHFCDSHPGVRQDMDQDRPQFGNWFKLRRQLGDMGRFFESRPEVEQALVSNPSLIDNQNFLSQHPNLQNFLNSHPEIRQALDQNPSGFMTLEVRFQINMRGRLAVTRMDQFFDSHENVESALAAKPSLIDDKNFLHEHPELQQFLNSHPEVRNFVDRNPALFMKLEARYEGSAADQYADAQDGNLSRNGNPDRNGDPTANNNPNPDLKRGEVASMDQFLDSHPDVEKQLQSNPSLINNVKYLNDHPQLRAFLDGNPQIREEFTENPSYFMQRENQFEAHENGSGQVATMDAYLDKHPGEARELNAYPARINDSDYLSHHKDLEAFLKKHPEVREQFMSNPSSFMHQESSFDACAQLDDFLNAHRKVAKDLDQNPANVKDTAFLNHHKDLKHFFDKNPGVNDQFQTDPHGFWYREQHFEAERQMDAYFSTHQGVAKDLQKNPDRVKDASYLDHHKDLKELMNKNPQLEESANTNPSAFMQEQMKFHEQYRNQHEQQKTKVQERATVQPH